jgi:hypothetical protein
VTTVGTSTSTNPTVFPFQKKCFYANGRWWVFYYDGSNFGWRTSVDGSTWSDFTNYYAAVSTYFDVWYDDGNNKICLARAQGSTANLYYRQGTANGDGTITWDSDEVQVTTENAFALRLCKDSNGYPWISYMKYSSSYALKVVKATQTNGSAWETPTSLWDETSTGPRIVIVPLTNSKMLAIRSASNAVFQSRFYDGSSWASAVSASSSSLQSANYFDAVADGDNVHLVFCKYSTYDIVYLKYAYGSGWGSEETVESSTVAQYHPVISLKSTDSVRVFYLLSLTTIKYRDRDSGSWQTAVTISSNESTMLCVCSSYRAFSSKLCVTWKSGVTSPYNVKFEGYTLGGAILKEVTDSSSLSDAVLRDKTLAISDSAGLVDTLLRDRTFQISDEFNLTGIIFRDKTFTVTDSISLSEIIEVATGAVIKYVADAIGLTEQIKVDKAFIVSEAINLFDQVFRHRSSITVADVIALVEAIAIAKTLAITDQITLAETVEKAVAGGVKTKIFLLIGDLVIQVTG